MRYRLRFVLQELDLPQGGTIIGRSLDCQLTLEDPLVSRRHALIFVDAGGARIEDMGSRNGVRVNGAIIREPTLLRNGDRVRIGTQDFVFSCVDAAGRAHSRTTGHLRLCANCRLPYPRELLACPSCEATEQTDDDTLTGSHGTTAWNLQLSVESLERALRLSRVDDAKRIVERAAAQVEELIGTGIPVDPTALGGLAIQAVALSVVCGESNWARWVLDVYGRVGRVPQLAVVERYAGVAPKERVDLCESLDALLLKVDPGASDRTAMGVGSRPPPSVDDARAIARLRELRRAFAIDNDAGPVVASKGARHVPTA